ncbi:MAG: hypothetical protein GXO77_12360 [Calditrichaeota bacterium]|nr:hypothetical protein [Calditrichota bacterium]
MQRSIYDYDKVKSAGQRLDVWLKRYHNAQMISQAKALPLRRDMITLLTFVRDNKVIGTQSTGNMPLKAVREVTARFVKPPELETTIGDLTFRLRSEIDVWSLYFLHILADVGSLLAIAPGRRWRLTPDGEDFLGSDPLMQVSYLLTIWWYEINWLVAYPFKGMGDELPPFFNLTALTHLRSLPVGRRIPFEKFADELIEKTGLSWTTQDSFDATMFLHGSIERMLIDILAAFDAVESEYRDEPLGKGTISKLVAFEITPFGRALLDSVAIWNV